MGRQPSAMNSRGQIVEQLGMRRQPAVEAEIAGRLHQPLAKVVVPDAIDHHPGRERIRRAADPAGQRQRGARPRAHRPAVTSDADGRDRRRAPPLRAVASARRDRDTCVASGCCERAQVGHRRAQAGRAGRAACAACAASCSTCSATSRAAGRRRRAALGAAGSNGWRSSPVATVCQSLGRSFARLRCDTRVARRSRIFPSRSRAQTTRSIAAGSASSICTQPPPASAEIQLRPLPYWPSLNVLQLVDLVGAVGIDARGRGLGAGAGQRHVARLLARR